MARPLDRRELADKSFTCLPGCGFCCTFQPEASPAELKALRATRTFIPVLVADGRTYLGLQGEHGACHLLKDRQCSAYADRPAHCRFFPFHVYFGERTEVYVDLSCRGVVDARGAALDRAFSESGAEAAAAAHADGPSDARKAHRLFREKALAEDAWTDPRGAIEALRARAPALATGAEVARLAEAAGESATLDALAQAALSAFDGPVRTRPFWLDADLRWLTLDLDGADARLVEMQEDGRLDERGRIEGLARHAEVPTAVAEALAPYARLLYARDVFRGSSFARVDDHGYAFGVAEAVHARAAEIGADLALRARVVAAVRPALGPEQVAGEVARFYDADFLDSTTIGGFL